MSKLFKQAVQISLGLALVTFAAQSVQAGSRPPGSVRPPSTATPVRPPNFGFIPTRPGGGTTSVPSTPVVPGVSIPAVSAPVSIQVVPAVRASAPSAPASTQVAPAVRASAPSAPVVRVRSRSRSH